MNAYAIKNIETGLYWTGTTWGPLSKAREWMREETAVKQARKLGQQLPKPNKLGIVQTV